MGVGVGVDVCVCVRTYVCVGIYVENSVFSLYLIFNRMELVGVGVCVCV